MLAIVGKAAIAVKRIIRIIAGIHHHDGHSYAPGSVGSLNGQGKSAWLEAVDRVQAAGEFAVDAVLLVGQDAALEIVIAVGGGERHFRFDDRAKEAGKRAADFVTGLVHELVQSRRHILWIGCCGVDQRGRGGRGGRGLLDVGIAAVRLHGQQTIVHAVSGPPLDSAQLGLDFGDRTHASARFLATFSTQIVSVAVGWQVYDLTRDPFDLGLVGIIQFAPSLLLVLVTGAAADRFGRRLIMGAAAMLETLCALALLVLTMRSLDGVSSVFVVLAVFGIARAFFAPASASLVANLVPAEDFANAVAWNSSAWQTATIVGPVAGGLLYGLSAETAYATATLLMAGAAALSFAIAAPRQRGASEKATVAALFAGFRYIWSEKIVLGAVSLDLFAVLLSGAVALLPVYARDILELGPWGLGLLRAAPGIGAVAVALWLAGHPIRDHAGVLLFVFVGLFGVFTVVFGVSSIPWVSIVALAFVGATDMVSVYVRETLIQLWTPDRVRGRVNAVNSLFTGTSNQLGQFQAGVMATLLGTVPAVIFGGCGTLLVVAIWMRFFPAIRRRQTLSRSAD